MRKVYLFLIFLLPFSFLSCDKKESDVVSEVAATQSKLKGEWNKVSYEYKFYDKGTTNLVSQDGETYFPGDYDEYTDTEYSEYLSGQKMATIPYEIPDPKHIKFKYIGAPQSTVYEIRELTLNKLVLYREYITVQPGSDEDGDKVTITYTCSR